MRVGDYDLANEEKYRRVIDGTQGGDGGLVGGLGVDASEEDILAYYDKFGGLITKNGDTVKNGSFWDFKAKKPLAKPKVFFVYRINGRVVEVPEGTELPGEVRAARLLASSVEADEVEEKPKKRLKKKVADEE